MHNVPWIENPYRLVSWWNMEEFSAEAFFEMGSLLTRIQNITGRLAEMESEARILGKDRQEDPFKKRKIEIHEAQLEALGMVENACNRIGLRQPLKHIIPLRARLQNGDLGADRIQTAIAELHARIRDEMEDHLFMHITASQAFFYQKPELFGKEVNAKFPDIQFDIVEAGNCYASGRGTAVVFHLMRIMETGVQAFGTKIGVTLADEKNWQNILDEVNKAIKALPPKDPATVKMSQVSANLYAVKLAWRNEVMHPKDTYTLEEADNLIRQVKIFMKQLAELV